MKKEIHPDDYRLVVFQDISCDYTFITRSTVKTSDTIKWEDGKEYPLYKVEISSASHPFYTGKQKFVDENPFAQTQATVSGPSWHHIGHSITE